MELGKYLKAAFLNRWNLLGLLGGLGFSLLSYPDIAIPLLMAVEISYLALLGTHPKFQKFVDAQEAAGQRSRQSIKVTQALKRVMQALPEESIQRFETLRKRCSELRQIALDLERPGGVSEENSLGRAQLAGLDRLLWIYLKLLFTQYSLKRFFAATEESTILAEIKRAQDRIEEVQNQSTSSQRDRILETLRDTLETCQQRLANYRKARDNFELVQFEIERLENKIRSISELAVNRQDPNFISGQVDQVASSMLKTEETINELQFVTGFVTADDKVPELVEQRTLQIQ